MSTTSGRSSWARATAPPPFGASPTMANVIGRFQQHPETGPDQRLVIGEQDADHGAVTAAGAAAGSRATTSKPPAGPARA